MPGLPNVRRLIEGVPVCPVCEGPCTHEFTRSEWRFPDRLPMSDDRSADPEPVKEKKPNRRGRRPEHHAKDRPTEDRARTPDEDR